MLNNYIKIAWRSIAKRRFYTAINVAGLALAMACCLLIYVYISYHLSFDTYHKRPNNIFRLVDELHIGKTEYDKGSSFAMLKGIQAQIPQVEQSVLMLNNQSAVVDVNGDVKKRFKEEKSIAFTNSGWFKVFTYNWLSGDATQLDAPYAAVLTQKLATKYWGNQDPIGKILAINGTQFKVTGLLDDAPFNTDMRADMYLSITSVKGTIPLFEKEYFTSWGYNMSTNNGFLVLNNANQQTAVEKAILAMDKRSLGPDANKYYTFKLLPLTDMHFDARYGGPVQKSLLAVLAIIGALIMAIAIINYINMTIAQQARRSIEIGTRKVLGGSSVQLFMQFMTESLLTSTIAVVLAGLLIAFFMPMVNTLLFADAPIHILSHYNMYLFLGIMLIFITVAAGVYPALMLSKVSVFNALKNNALNLTAGTGRKVLIVLQNVVAQALIAGTIIIVLQVRFLKNTDKGFDRKFVVMVPLGDELSASKQERLSHSLKAMPGVQAFSFCLNQPASASKRGATFNFDARANWETFAARFAIGDSGYYQTFGLHLVAGRNIRDKQLKPEFLVNEKMVAMLHIKNANAILGKNMTAGDIKGVIVGVVKDFNVKSLLEPIEPTVVLEEQHIRSNLAVKFIGKQSIAAGLSDLQNTYQQVLPDQLFSYQFVDDEIALLYKTESLQQKMIWSAAIVAIFISSLGLLGLISLITLQRTKEIGIRKVLGATVTQINLMLSKDFLRLVLVALVIATPLSYWATSKWLQKFAYRIDIHWWVFALAGSGAVLIAIITISFQSVKAALANPVDSLRNE
jgi:putative ABC transport system permease protein